MRGRTVIFYHMLEGIVLLLIFSISFWCLYTLKKKEKWFFLVFEPLSLKEIFFISFVSLGIFMLMSKGYMSYILAWLVLAYFTFEYRSKIFINPSFTLELKNNPVVSMSMLLFAFKTGDFTTYQFHHAFSTKAYPLSQEHISLYQALWKNQAQLLPILKSVNVYAMKDPLFGNSLMQTVSGSIMLSSLPEKDFNIHTDYLTKKLGLSAEQMEFFKKNYLPDIYEKAKFVRNLSSAYDIDSLKRVQPEKESLETCLTLSQEFFQQQYKQQFIKVPLEAIGVQASFNSLVLASSTLDVVSRLEILCNDPSASKYFLNSGYSAFNFQVKGDALKGYYLLFTPNYGPELTFIEQGLKSGLILSWKRVSEEQLGDFKVNLLIDGEVLYLNKNVDVKYNAGAGLSKIKDSSSSFILAIDVSAKKESFDKSTAFNDLEKSLKKPAIIFNSSNIKLLK